MTDFYAVNRQRLGSRPTWEGSTIALPHLVIDPQPDGTWLVAILLPAGVGPGRPHGDGTWALQHFELAEVPILLEAWRSNPEETLQRVFFTKPPVAPQAVPSSSSSGNGQDPAPIIDSTDLSLDDLGL